MKGVTMLLASLSTEVRLVAVSPAHAAGVSEKRNELLCETNPDAAYI